MRITKGRGRPPQQEVPDWEPDATAPLPVSSTAGDVEAAERSATDAAAVDPTAFDFAPAVYRVLGSS